MKYLDLTLPSPEANLACDEALLEAREADECEDVLRVWEPARHFVVVGYSNQLAREVNLEECRRREIPVLRRCSGGGSVVQGPGCLNYCLCLKVDDEGPLSTVTRTNSTIMGKLRQMFQDLLHTQVEMRGHTDLAIENRKFSGNAQRRKQHSVLFHGSFLLNEDLSLIQALLPPPSKQPAYRADRTHADFLCSLSVAPATVKAALRKTWEAAGVLEFHPAERTSRLVSEKYGQNDWNERF